MVCKVFNACHMRTLVFPFSSPLRKPFFWCQGMRNPCLLNSLAQWRDSHPNPWAPHHRWARSSPVLPRPEGPEDRRPRPRSCSSTGSTGWRPLLRARWRSPDSVGHAGDAGSEHGASPRIHGTGMMTGPTWKTLTTSQNHPTDCPAKVRKPLRTVWQPETNIIIPRHSMYAIYTYIDPQNHPNVGKYAKHGVSGRYCIIYDPHLFQASHMFLLNRHPSQTIDRSRPKV